MKTALTLPARSALVQLTPEILPVVSVSTLHPAAEPVQCLDIFIESDLIRARSFEQFGTVCQDAADNKALLAKSGKITMPVFAIGAEKFFGKGMADEMRLVASNVTGGIVPNSGHWIMEQNPQATIKLVTDFLSK